MKNRHSNSARNAGFTLCSAMVAALLAGCAGGPHGVASAGDARVAEGQVAGVDEGALSKVEARVAKSPRDMGARSALAQGYLAAGRFNSAATTFEDALALGDRSPRTGLSLALAYIGSGRKAEALDVLQRFANKLPASDYGLAVALAGQPAQGVEVLSQAVRGGESQTLSDIDACAPAGRRRPQSGVDTGSAQIRLVELQALAAHTGQIGATQHRFAQVGPHQRGLP